MVKFVVISVALGLAVSGAQACEFQRSAKTDKVDQTTVASISLPQAESVQTDATLVPVPATDIAK